MKPSDVAKQAFAMPLTSPSYPKGPYRFIDREFLTITYRTDIDALRAVVPEPLEITDPLVKYEFIRMPDSTGFGDYTESGQVIPVTLDGVAGGICGERRHTVQPGLAPDGTRRAPVGFGCVRLTRAVACRPRHDAD